MKIKSTANVNRKVNIRSQDPRVSCSKFIRTSISTMITESTASVDYIINSIEKLNYDKIRVRYVNALNIIVCWQHTRSQCTCICIESVLTPCVRCRPISYAAQTKLHTGLCANLFRVCVASQAFIPVVQTCARVSMSVSRRESDRRKHKQKYSLIDCA